MTSPEIKITGGGGNKGLFKYNLPLKIAYLKYRTNGRKAQRHFRMVTEEEKVA